MLTSVAAAGILSRKSARMEREAEGAVVINGLSKGESMLSAAGEIKRRLWLVRIAEKIAKYVGKERIVLPRGFPALHRVSVQLRDPDGELNDLPRYVNPSVAAVFRTFIRKQ